MFFRKTVLLIATLCASVDLLAGQESDEQAINEVVVRLIGNLQQSVLDRFSSLPYCPDGTESTESLCKSVSRSDGVLYWSAQKDGKRHGLQGFLDPTDTIYFWESRDGQYVSENQFRLRNNGELAEVRYRNGTRWTLAELNDPCVSGCNDAVDAEIRLMINYCKETNAGPAARGRCIFNNSQILRPRLESQIPPCISQCRGE